VAKKADDSVHRSFMSNVCTTFIVVILLVIIISARRLGLCTDAVRLRREDAGILVSGLFQEILKALVCM
jgi:hypothetical protein